MRARRRRPELPGSLAAHSRRSAPSLWCYSWCSPRTTSLLLTRTARTSSSSCRPSPCVTASPSRNPTIACLGHVINVPLCCRLPFLSSHALTPQLTPPDPHVPLFYDLVFLFSYYYTSSLVRLVRSFRPLRAQSQPRFPWWPSFPWPQTHVFRVVQVLLHDLTRQASCGAAGICGALARSQVPHCGHLFRGVHYLPPGWPRRRVRLEEAAILLRLLPVVQVQNLSLYI